MLNGHVSLEDMRQQNREIWEKEFAQPLRAQFFNSIMDSVLSKNPFTPPSSWIDKEIELTIRRLNASGLRGNNSAMSALRTLSERTVKIAYILDRIYEKEVDLHISPADFMNLANEEGTKSGLSGVDFIQKLKDENHYEGFVVLHEQGRVIDFLINNAVKEELADGFVSN